MTKLFTKESLFCIFLAATATQAEEVRLTEFMLPERPEGIVEGPGPLVFVSQIKTGGVLGLNVISGEITTIVDDQSDGRQAWGLSYYDQGNKNAIFVAGGGPSFGAGRPEVYVYDVETGEELVTCSPLSFSDFGQFLNDITIRNAVAYITDSVHEKLMAMDVEDALMGSCNVWEVALPEALKPTFAFDFGANGIIPYGEGLLVVDEFIGAVWYVPIDGGTEQEVIPACPVDGVADDSCALFGDGLVMRGNLLYVTQNFLNEIGVFKLKKLSGGVISAERVDTLSSDAYQTPAVSAIFGGYLYSTNSRFEEITSDPVEDLEGPEKVVAVKL